MEEKGDTQSPSMVAESVTLALGYLKEANLACRMQSCSSAPCSAVLFVFGFLYVSF